MIFYGFCNIAEKTKPNKTLAKTLGLPEVATPATDRWAQGGGRHHQAGSRPRAALTPRLGAPTRARARRGGAGGRRRGGARLEELGARAHGVP